MKKWFMSLPNRWYDVLYLGLYIGLVLVSLCVYVQDTITMVMDPTVAFADLFYNYGGGFIRRGLGGEIMFWFNDYLGIPPRVFYFIVSGGAYTFLAYIFVKLFRRKGYGLNVLIMTFILGGIVVDYFEAYRRDYIELSLLAVSFLLYKRMKWKQWCILSNTILVFGILLHEATFFFSVPILILITNLRTKNILKAIVYWSPTILAFLACCYYKGTPEMIRPICDRAAPYYPVLFEDGEVPSLLTFIGKDLIETFDYHIGVNYTWFTTWGLRRAVFTLFAFVYMPYMTIAMLRAFSPKGLSSTAASGLLKILLFQFVCLIPMWTVLSCDLLRVSTYWFVSSLLVWLIFSAEEVDGLFKPMYNRIMEKITLLCYPITKLGRFPLTMLALCVGVTPVWRSIQCVFLYSPFGAVRSAVDWLWGLI